MKTNKFLPINWTDGVKLTKEHFFNSYFNVVSTINNYSNTQLNNFNYGLIESSTSLDLDVVLEGENQIIATLKHCSLIAKNGHLIRFDAKLYGEDFPSAEIDTSDLSQNSTENFYIVVSINPYHLIPVGVPDPEMVPLHHPNALPEIKLHIISQNSVNENFLEGYFLILKKIKLNNGSLIVDENYIPPIMKSKFNETYKKFIESVIYEINQINEFSIRIHKKNIHNSMNNRLVLNTFSLCEKIINFNSESNFTLKNIAKEMPPIFLTEKISSLAHQLLSTLTLMDEKEKEMLLQYYYEWIDVKPSELLSVLFDVSNIEYDHNNIHESLHKMDTFVGIIKKLWLKLSELEYIGVRKENIVISEETNQSVRRNKTWSILD